MKAIIAIIFLCWAVTGSAQQSLRDALYSGKLKTDSGTVIRKGEDLSTKIDSNRKAPPPVEEVASTTTQAPAFLSSDSALLSDTAATKNLDIDSLKVAAKVRKTAVDAKDNNVVWKEYIDSLRTIIQSEVIPNKKIKSGTYSVLIDYEIDLDGTINVKNVSASPESSFLEQQVRERITLTAPTLTPLLNQYGKPRKALKKQTFALNK